MNYEYQRQKNWHVTEICTGVWISNAHKTRNKQPLRLNMLRKLMHIYQNHNHFYPQGTSLVGNKDELLLGLRFMFISPTTIEEVGRVSRIAMKPPKNAGYSPEGYTQRKENSRAPR